MSAHPSRQPSDAPNGAPAGRAPILVVERDTEKATAIVQLLEKHGYEGIRAGGEVEALTCIDEASAEIVIADASSASFDGYELCRAIRSNPSRERVRILLMLPLADPAELIRALDCRADGFIRKPFDEATLIRRIEALRPKEERSGEALYADSDLPQLLAFLAAAFDDAVALSNELENRERDLRRANHVLGGLYRIAEGLNQATTEQEVADLALDRALDLPGIRAGWIFLRKSDGSFRVAASRNLPAVLKPPAAMSGLCTCQRRLLDGSLDKVTNILECERLQKPGDTEGLRFHASVPLRLGNRNLGLMNLVGPNEGLFNDEELRILYGVGTQLAVALDRARLREDLERLVEQ